MHGQRVRVVRRLGDHGEDRAGLRVERDDRARVVAERVVRRLLHVGVDGELDRRALRDLAGDDLRQVAEELVVRRSAQVVVHRALDAGVRLVEGEVAGDIRVQLRGSCRRAGTCRRRWTAPTSRGRRPRHQGSRRARPSSCRRACGCCADPFLSWSTETTWMIVVDVNRATNISRTSVPTRRSWRFMCASPPVRCARCRRVAAGARR